MATSVREQELQRQRGLERALNEFKKKGAELAGYWEESIAGLYEAREMSLRDLLVEPAIPVTESECIRCHQKQGDPHLTSACRDKARLVLIRDLVETWRENENSLASSSREPVAAEGEQAKSEGEDEAGPDGETTGSS